MVCVSQLPKVPSEHLFHILCGLLDSRMMSLLRGFNKVAVLVFYCDIAPTIFFMHVTTSSTGRQRGLSHPTKSKCTVMPIDIFEMHPYYSFYKLRIPLSCCDTPTHDLQCGLVRHEPIPAARCRVQCVPSPQHLLDAKHAEHLGL